MSEANGGKMDRLLAELRKTFVIFVYLALFLGAFATYRRLLLEEYQISYFHYGCSVVEALVLAKVIVFGSMLRLGERFDDRPLIIPTLYKSLGFSLLILAFSILERFLVGWWHGEVNEVILEKFLDEGIWEILAQSFVKFLALLPLFAVWEIGRVLGEGKLSELFFTKGASAISPSNSVSVP